MFKKYYILLLFFLLLPFFIFKNNSIQYNIEKLQTIKNVHSTKYLSNVYPKSEKEKKV